MKRQVFAMCAVLLLISAIAWAAPRGGGNAGVQWWPGEGPGARENVKGKVLAISPTSITVQTKDGQPVFAITPETRVMVHGEKSTIDKIAVGDPVIVRFGANTDGTRFARGIAVPETGYAGQITAVNGSTLTLTSQDQTWNVTITPETKISAQRYVGTPADLHVGYTASVQGDANGTNITAKTIEFRPTVVKGVVQQVSGNTITITTLRKKTATITVCDATAVLIRPRTDKNVPGTLADVKPGVAVNIGGHITGEGTLNALWIDILVAGFENPGTGPGNGTTGAQRPAWGKRAKQLK